jgi:hypothetical protein
MYLKLPFKTLAKPSSISMLAVFFSFLAWEIPSFDILRKGYDIQQQFDVVSVVTLTLWYGLVFCAFFGGQKLGKVAVSSLQIKTSYPLLDSDAVYWWFTVLAAIGTSIMFLTIVRSLSLPMLIFYLTAGQANMLSIALHENYSFGFVSLRYLVVYSAAIAFYRMVRSRSISVLGVLNIVMLALNSTARLIIISTLLIAMFLLASEKRVVRINIAKASILGGVVFSILSVVNFSRNYGFYESHGFSFWGAGVSEIVAYLDTPFQASVGSAKALDDVVAGGGETYRRYSGVEESFNTNSAFVLLHEQIGYFAWPYIGLMCAFMGFVFSLMRTLGRTGFLLPCGGILYASSELWRLDMFQQGIFIVWFSCGIGVPLGLLILKRTRTALSKMYPVHNPSTQ